jgi:predicted small lipoprotein YifL
VIARNVAGSVLVRLVKALVLGLALVSLTSLAGCKKKKPKPFPPAPLLSATATTAGASLDAGVIPVNVVTAAPVAPPPPADTMSPPDRAAFEQTKAQLRELDAMVKQGVVTNPAKPDEGDATMRCAEVESSRPRLEVLADPDVKALVAESKRLCSLEVPILSADKTLKQVTVSPSQASRQLMCKYASKDLDKAKKEKPNDRRVRDLDGRFTRACR